MTGTVPGTDWFLIPVNEPGPQTVWVSEYYYGGLTALQFISSYPQCSGGGLWEGSGGGAEGPLVFYSSIKESSVSVAVYP